MSDIDRQAARTATLALAIAAGLLFACAGEDQPNELANRSASLFVAGSDLCDANETLLFLLRPDPDTSADPYGCTCSSAGLDSCVADACLGHPEAECDPVHGFRCSGVIEFAADDGCPPGFEDDNGTCRGRLPRTCAFDSDCPVGAYCSTSRGGVCWWDCLVDCVAHPEACCESGSTCGCDGRCHDDEGEDAEDPPSPRAMLEVTPSTLRFESGDDQSILTEARRLVVTARPPAGSYEPQEVHVVTDRGVKVACQATAYADQPTDPADYHQSCALTFDGGADDAQGVWVLPTSLETPVSNDGSPHRWHVELRAGAETNLATRDVLVVHSDAALPTPPTSGEYTGVVYLERAWLAPLTEASAVGTDGLPLAGVVAVPVTATVDIRSDATEITLYDTTRSFAANGLITLSFPGDLADGPPATSAGQPLLMGPWSEWDQAARDLGFDVMVDDGTTVGFISASTERPEVAGRFGVITTELNDDVAPALVCSFRLTKTSDRVVAPPEPEVVSPSQAPLEIALAHGAAALLEPGGLSWAEWIGLLGEGANVASCLYARELNFTAWGQDFRGACERYLAPAAQIPPEQAFDFCVDILDVALAEPELPGTSALVNEFFVPCCDSGCNPPLEVSKASCTDAGSICNSPLGDAVVVDSSQIPGASWQGVLNIKFCNIDAALYSGGGNTTNGADRFAARSDQCAHRMFGFDAAATYPQHVTSTNTLFSVAEGYTPNGFTRRPGMRNSGDLEISFAGGNSPRVPITFGFSYQEDLRDLPPFAESVLTASEMVRACLDDLSRSFPDWVWNPPSLAASQGSHINDLLAELFSNEGCISMAGFLLSLDWMADAGGNDRLFARRLQQWLEVHTFVARHGYQESEAVEALLGVENEAGDAPALADGVEWGEVLDTVERGWSLILHPRIYARILAVAGESWLEPDYRRDWLAEDEPILDGDFPYLQEGLPVALLDASAAQLNLVAHYLRAQQGAIATAKDTAAYRNSVLSRYGNASRASLVVEGIANSLYEAAREAAPTGEAVPWLDAWRKARGTLAAARADALDAASLAASSANPLGIEDVDLPLYFVDPQGVNSKFFASSDYLLVNWAKPAVSEALASLEGARNAWLSKRDSEIREKINENDNARRIEDLKRQYGSVLVNACGLSIREEEALEAFANGQYSTDTCFIAGSADSDVCRSRLAVAAGLVGDPEADGPAPEECEDPYWTTPEALVETKRALCVISREYALWQAAAPGESIFGRMDQQIAAYHAGNAPWFDGWTNAVAAGVTAFEDRLPSLAAYFAASPMSGGDLTSDDATVYEQEKCVGLFDVPTTPRCDAETPTLWDRLDAVTVANCGRTILFDGTRPLFLPSYDNDQGGIRQAVINIRQLADAIWPSPRSLETSDPFFLNLLGFRYTGYWCKEYLETSAGTLDVSHEYVNPDELAQCLRGDLGVYQIQMLKAREQVRLAKVQLTSLVDKYDAAMKHCLVVNDTNEAIADATDSHLRAMERLREAQESASLISGFLNVVTSIATTAANPVSAGGIVNSATGLANTALGSDLAEQAAEFERQHTLTMMALEGQKELSGCLLGAQNYETEVATHVESIQLALLNVAESLVEKKSLETKLRNLISEGTAAIEREAGRTVVTPSFHYWLDERVDAYKRDFAWAQRLTYLALRAIEYEAQATLPIRSQILQAKNPIALDEAVREMEREQLTRSIAGSRPEEKSIVLSLTDELLQVSDRTLAPAGELRLTPTDGLQRQLLDKANAIFDQRGEYLGQGIRFTLEPQGPLHYRCAERLWSVAATVQGDLIGRVEPSLPLFVLKRNTFRSQWCGQRPADDGLFQTVSLRPSADLMRPGTQTGDSHEAEADSWAYVEAWVNVSRSEFYQAAYAEGSSDELAGRGLYGDYMLLLPWHGLLDSGIRIQQIEDILIRFDYLSVSNGAHLTDEPPSLGDVPVPRLAVDQLQLTPGANRMYVSWRNPVFFGLDKVIVRRSTGDYPATPEDGELIAAIECYDGACDRYTEVVDGGLVALEPVYYTAFTIDAYGDFVTTWEGGTPSAAPAVTNVTATDALVGQIDVSWTNPTFDGFTGVTVVRKQGAIPVDEADGTVIYDGTAESWSDTTATAAVEYYYRVFGVDDFDVVTPGAYDTGTWTVPPPVDSVSAESTSAGDVTITWNDAMANLDVKVLRTDTGIPPADDEDGTLVYAGSSSEVYVDEDVPANIVYHYAVFACYQSVCSTTGPSDSASWYQIVDDFESGLGNWLQAITGDDFDWTRTDSATPSANTGPSGAADGSTWYLFTEATGNLSTKKAIIRGPAIDMSTFADGSVEFYWHMYGADMGALSIEVSDDGDPSQTDVLWSRSGDQGDQSWHLQTVSLTEGAGGEEEFYLLFRGTTASGNTSDIAIDEVTINLWGEL